MILHVESAAWASRLRYLAPKLLSRLRHDYPGLRATQIRVRPAGEGRSSRRQARLSSAARAALADAAAGLPDAELAAALARLGKAGEPDD